MLPAGPAVFKTDKHQLYCRPVWDKLKMKLKLDSVLTYSFLKVQDKNMPKPKYSWNVLIKSKCCNCSCPGLKLSTTFLYLCVIWFCEPSNASRFVVTGVAHSICVMECPFYRPYKPYWQGRRVTIHIVLTWTISVKGTAVATKVRGVNLTKEMVYEVINLLQEMDRVF